MENTKVGNVFLGVLAVIAAGTVLKLTSGFVIPLVIAVLLAFALSPLVDLFGKLRIPRFIGILLVIVLLLWLFYLVGLFLFATIQSFVRQYPRYQLRFTELYRDLIDRLDSDTTTGILSGIDWAGMLGRYVFSWSGSFVDFMGTVGMILIFLFFILLEQPSLRSRLAIAFHDDTAVRIARITRDTFDQTGRYLRIKLIISLATGASVWLSYTIIGVDFSLLWGSLTFLFNFIPSIGSIIIGIITFLFTVIQFYPSFREPFVVGVVMLALQNIIGNMIEPKLQGDSLNLSPVVILFSLMFWGWLWGVVGMFLAVPLTVTIKIVCENIPYLRPVSVLMGTGRETIRS